MTGEPTPTRTGFLYDDIYLRHDTGFGFPERPARLQAVVRRLTETGLIGELVRITPRSDGQAWIDSVHETPYIDRVKLAVRRGTGYVDTMDVPVSRDSYKVAVAAVAGVLGSVDAVVQRTAANVFCAVRPPGHHALPDRAMGFCLFNNIAIAARYAQRTHSLKRVLIVDWDVHHGNSTQAVFYDDPSVLYFSTHQYPFYPGTGDARERGEGVGIGTTVNVPLPAGTGDADYIRVFEEYLLPNADEFRPDLVLVSAGFDAHRDDPLGGMNVTQEGFAELTSIVKGIAGAHAKGRLVSVLEGGYGLDGLAGSTEAHLRALMPVG